MEVQEVKQEILQKKPGWIKVTSPSRASNFLNLVLAGSFVLGTVAAPASAQADADSEPWENSSQPGKRMQRGNGHGPGPGPQADYRVFAFNDLGMHCYDPDFSVFMILPPFNVVKSQVVQVGPRPNLLDDTSLGIWYQAQADPNGSITSSGAFTADGTLKTNFWHWVQPTLGLALLPDQGIPVPVDSGNYQWMPAMGNPPDNIAQPFAHYKPEMGWFSAEGIPITNLDDQGNLAPFPLISVQARANNGTVLASLPTVVPNSDEMACDRCHDSDWTGSDLFSDGTADNLGITWSTAADPAIRIRENILLIHDYRNSGNYPDDVVPAGETLFGLYQAGQPKLCASCHYSPALDLPPQGTVTRPRPGIPWMSHAMHGFHANVIPQTPLHSPYVNYPCFNCHPGEETQCLRGVMGQQESTVLPGEKTHCIDCHGNMYSVGGVNLDRYPWVDEPMCQSCHVGDVWEANAKWGGTLVFNRAWTGSADAAVFRTAPGSIFAENPAPAGYPGRYNALLYRNSRGHKQMDMACEACHGSPHAIWPSQEANDNLAALQLQGYDGMIIKCATCHGENFYPRGNDALGGPHGLHVVNSQRWANGGHDEIAEDNPDACRACHGLLGEGTVISEAAFDRRFDNIDDAGTVTFSEGQPIGCYHCHENYLAGANNGD